MNQSRFSSRNYKVLSAPISCASGTTQTVVAAIAAVLGGPGTGLAGSPAQSIAVVGFTLTGDTTATTGTFKTSTGPVNLTGAMKTAANGQVVQPVGDGPLFQTAPGDALQLVAATGALAGWVNYILLPGQANI